MRTAATPWDALLCPEAPQTLPAGVQTTLVADGRVIRSADQLHRHVAAEGEGEGERDRRLAELHEHLPATSTPWAARKQDWMRDYQREYRKRNGDRLREQKRNWARKNAALKRGDRQTPTPERTD